MADIVTGSVTGQLDVTSLIEGHSDIRRESAHQSADIRRENAKEASDVIDQIKTSAWANSDRTGTEADRVVAQETAYFIAGQSQNFSNATALAALKAGTDMQFANTLAAINSSAQQGQAATALEGAKNAAATALGQANITNAIATDGNATRSLINSLKMDELNRVLAERQAEIIEYRGDSRHYRDGVSNLQSAALSNQINALHSQFQAATQKTVNFGTMGANTNTSSNNVA
jgi:hypothetical protein